MFSFHDKVPEAWTEAVDWVREATGGDAVLAGGALRDLVNGVEIKDLDIFVPWSLEAYNGMRERLRLEGATLGQYVPPFAASYGSMKDVIAILGFEFRGLPLNIIFLSSEEEKFSVYSVISRIDFGICQIGMNREGILQVTPAFLNDLTRKTFTNLRFGDEPRARRRWERISQKYPGWRAVNLEPPVIPEIVEAAFDGLFTS
jgi:hypothetical protein